MLFCKGSVGEKDEKTHKETIDPMQQIQTLLEGTSLYKGPIAKGPVQISQTVACRYKLVQRSYSEV